MRACLVVLTAAAALLAGCGGSSDPSGEGLDPEALVLRTGDLPAGFSVDAKETGPVSNADVAAGRPAGYAQRLDEWGRLDGYTAAFERKSGDDLGGAVMVESRSSVYSKTDGAADSLTAGLPEYAEAGFREVKSAVDLGDELHVFSTTAATRGQTLEYVVAAWRTGPVLSTVVVAAPVDARLSPATVAPLAEIQERRVLQALATD